MKAILYFEIMTKSKTLHIYCDYWEPSVSRAVQLARDNRLYRVKCTQLRTDGLATALSQLADDIKENDLGAVVLMRASSGQLKQAGKVARTFSTDLRGRITISCSEYFPEVKEWADKNRFVYAGNPYEAERNKDFSGPSGHISVTMEERYWIQYRLMRALIKGGNPEDVYAEIVKMCRAGKGDQSQLRRGRAFVAHGEPDMAGGQYASDRNQAPNRIDLLREEIVKVGRSGLNTLIIGETGTGKESLAWYLHDLSSRVDGPFLAINCAFFEGERLESELFGHLKGSFTDAKSDKDGLVEKADRGTLFLDELPEMSQRVQAKLLRFLQHGTYTPLGGTEVRRADVRVISAAQPERILSLREDLYYRVADVELATVPLRELEGKNIADIACNLAYRLMWRTMTDAAGAQERLTPDKIVQYWEKLRSPELIEKYKKHEWPGNMRELSGLVKRMVLLGYEPFQRDESYYSTALNAASAAHVRPKELTGSAGASAQGLHAFTLPVKSIEDIAKNGLTLHGLQEAFVQDIVAALGGWDKVDKKKLAVALGCVYNTLAKYGKKKD